MSQDQMQSVFPIEFGFVKGEQPSATKFTGWIKQTDTALEKVTSAIGDLWETQQHSGSGGNYFLSPSRIAQASLARFGGPSDYVGPRGASFQEAVVTPATVRLRSYKNTWSLGFPLVKLPSAITDHDSGSTITELDWSTDITVVSAPTGMFVTEQSSAEDVTATGDFYVDYKRGIVTTYERTDATVELTIDNINMMGPGVPWATANVIPSWEQTASLCYVSEVSSGGGTTLWNIALPAVEEAPRKQDSFPMLGAPVHFDEPFGQDVMWQSISVPGESALHRMPIALIANLSDGDEIPEGYMYLWDDNLGRITTQLTFYYKDENNVRVEGPTGWLTLGSTARLIVTGTSLAEAVHYLMSSVRESRHVGLTSGQMGDTLAFATPISHDLLSDNYSGDIPSSVTDPERYYFCESAYPMNPHPQYMHRGGYMEDDVDGNSANAMRGNLVFSGVDDFALGNGPTTGGQHKATYGIMFGGYFDGTTNNTRIAFEGGADTAWTSGVATKAGFSLDATGARAKYYGALIYSPWNGTPLHLQGRYDDEVGFGGATIGFDLARAGEMNYIKLLAGNRSGSVHGVPNLPANTGQSGWSTTLGITPDLSFQLSPDQMREFRFRGVARVPLASNTGLTGAGTEFEHYFTSPGIVGADFFNVYSNAIFFSETGDGKETSFTQRADDWLNSGNHEPVGIYYEPSYSSSHGAFTIHAANSDNSRNTVCWLGYDAGVGFTSDSFYVSADTTILMDADTTVHIGTDTAKLGLGVSFGTGDVGLFAESDIWLLANDQIEIHSLATDYGGEVYARGIFDGTALEIELKVNNSTTATTRIYMDPTDILLYSDENIELRANEIDGNIALNAISGSINLNPGGGSGTTGLYIDTGRIYITSDPSTNSSYRQLYLYPNIDGGDSRIYMAASSTQRVKRDIQDMLDISWLYDLRPVNFNWKKDYCEELGMQYGLIAEEVDKVNDHFVGHDKESIPSYVSYEKFIPVLLKAIQDQKKEIDELKARLDN